MCRAAIGIPRNACWVLISASLLLLVACGGSGPVGERPSGSGAAATISASSTPTPLLSPGEVPQGRSATAEELQAMIAAGKKPAETYLRLGDSNGCAAQQSCLYTDQADGVIGINAGYFHGAEGCPSGCGGAGCWVYLYQDASGWHFVDAACAQSTGEIPGPQDTVRVSGCANVRDQPGQSGAVVGCLADQTIVDVDSAPICVDSKIWWHLKGKGWMAHDFLIAPPPPQ